MELADYVSTFRRRWWAIMLVVVIAVTAAVMSKPGKAAPPRYKATAGILVVDIALPFQSDPMGPQIAAGLLISGEVPKRAAAKLGFEGNPTDLAAIISTDISRETHIVSISATRPTAEDAALLASTFSSELLAYVQERTQQLAAAALERTKNEATDLETQARELDIRLARTPPGTDAENLKAQRSTITRQYQIVIDRVLALTRINGEPVNRLVLVNQPVPHVVSDNTFKPPASARARAALGALVGLILGAALALIVERLDIRISSKDQAERAFQFPVLTEVPPTREGRRQAVIATADHPRSAIAESYRTLATFALRLPLHDAPPNGASPAGGAHRTAGHAPSSDFLRFPQRKVILVTSPGPGEGKTTTAANLAVVMAESGLRVVVVAADTRRPMIHQYFDVPNSPGLTDVINQRGPVDFSQLARPTTFEGIRVIPSGKASSNPSQLLVAQANLIAKCRDMADVVIVDTPPLLVVNDVNELIRVADAVVVVARAGRTTTRSAAAAAEDLTRAAAPVVGVAMIGSFSAAAGYSDYYRYYAASANGNGNGAATNGSVGARKRKSSRRRHSSSRR